MSGPLNALHSRHDGITIPTIWAAFALSLILHAVALWGWPPKVMLLPFEDSRQGKPSGSLAVRLAPAPSAAPVPPPTPAIRAQPAPAHKTLPPTAAPRSPSAPRVLALERPSPSTATPPSPDDLASYIEAHRHAREPEAAPSQPPSESEQEHHNRVVAANLGLNRTPSFGAERRPGGGIFQVERVGYDSAEFFFYGWNKDIRRNSQQMIEVRRGDNPTMEIAVVRRMIAIIREHASGDFLWESPRLGRDITLSARIADNAGLEEFMMREFFPDRSRK